MLPFFSLFENSNLLLSPQDQPFASSLFSFLLSNSKWCHLSQNFHQIHPHSPLFFWWLIDEKGKLFWQNFVQMEISKSFYFPHYSKVPHFVQKKKWKLKFKLGCLTFCRLGWAEFYRYQNSKFNFDRLHFLVKNWTFKRVCFCAAVLSKSPFQSVKLTLNHFLESFKLCNLDHREVPAFCAWVKLQSDF